MNAGKKISYLKAKVLKNLIIRISLLGLGLVILISIYVFHVETDRLQAFAEDRMQIAVSRFYDENIHLFDAIPLDGQAIEVELKKYFAGRVDLRSGLPLFSMIVNRDSKIIATAAAKQIDEQKERTELLAMERHLESTISDFFRSDGSWFLNISMPLKNTDKKTVAWGYVTMLVPNETLHGMYFRISRSILIVVASVVILSLLLYQIISALIGKLANTSDALLKANLDMLEVLGSAIAKRDSDTDIHNYKVSNDRKI